MPKQRRCLKCGKPIPRFQFVFFCKDRDCIREREIGSRQWRMPVVKMPKPDVRDYEGTYYPDGVH